MNRTKKLLFIASLAGTLALAASPAAAQTYGGTGSGSGGSYGGTSSGTSGGTGTSGGNGTSGGTGTASSGNSSLALTGVDSADLALGGAILAGSGAIVTWGARRNRLVA